MQPYQRDFIRFAIDRGVLRFGEFTLKSGRTSPYFFNAGLFNTGSALAQLGRCYAAAIVDSGSRSTCCSARPTRASRWRRPPPWRWPSITARRAVVLQPQGSQGPRRRRQPGRAPLTGDVLIIDDVITAGTAIREVMQIIAPSRPRPLAC
jgi:orotate phosphoribosyltransferase